MSFFQHVEQRGERMVALGFLPSNGCPTLP